MGFFRKYIWGKRLPPVQPVKGIPAYGTAGAENFNFSDSLVANAPVAGNVGAYVPAPGTAVLEVLSGNGAVLTMDTIRVDVPALHGAYHALGRIPATYVRHRTGVQYQTFQIPLDGEHPFKMPQSILDKKEVGGMILRIYWSCM